MFSKEDIMAELAAGKRIEQIAQEAADALNLAKAAYDEKMAREAEAKKKAEAAALQKRKEKEARATNLMDGVLSYLTDFHSDFLNPAELAMFAQGFNAGALVDAIDATINEIQSIPAVAEQLKKCQAAKPAAEFTIELKDEDAKKAEDAIEKFLKKNGLF